MTNGRYWPTLAGNALDYMEVPVVPEMAPHHHHHQAVDAESHLRAARCPRYISPPYMMARSVPKQPQYAKSTMIYRRKKLLDITDAHSPGLSLAWLRPSLTLLRPNGRFVWTPFTVYQTC